MTTELSSAKNVCIFIYKPEFNIVSFFLLESLISAAVDSNLVS